MPQFCPELLTAYQRGLDEGYDNDGFTAALLEMMKAEGAAVREAVRSLAQSADRTVRENAAWLLTFCEAPGVQALPV